MIIHYLIMTTKTRQTTREEGSFEEKLRKVIGVSDVSRNSKCGLIRQYLATVLSSKQLYNQVAMRARGLLLFSAYLDDWNLHVGYLGLTTDSQLLKSLKSEYELSGELEIKRLRKHELLLVSLCKSTCDAYNPTIDSLITPKTILEYSSLPIIKEHIKDFQISPRSLEREIFEAVRDVKSEQLF